MSVCGITFVSTDSNSGSQIVNNAASINPSVQSSVWMVNGANVGWVPDGTFLVTDVTLCRAQGECHVPSGSQTGSGSVGIKKTNSGLETTVTVNPWNLTTAATLKTANFAAASAQLPGQPAQISAGPFGELTWTNGGFTASVTYTITATYQLDMYPMATGLVMSL